MFLHFISITAQWGERYNVPDIDGLDVQRLFAMLYNAVSTPGNICMDTMEKENVRTNDSAKSGSGDRDKCRG